MSYFLPQLSYSFSLKRIVILDVFAVASGFVLRVVADTLVISAEISSWLLICTILLALFLGLSKRRHELMVLEEEAQNHRTVLVEYSPNLLDQMISIVTASTVVAYCLYTMSAETIEKFGTRNLIFTVPFVLYGIFRYLYLVHQKGESGIPENILITDKTLEYIIFIYQLSGKPSLKPPFLERDYLQQIYDYIIPRIPQGRNCNHIVTVKAENNLT